MKTLVTGATGTIGRQLVSELSRRGVEVRAAGHSRERIETLEGPGVEPIAVDLNEPEEVARALEDVHRMFLLTPFVPEFERQVANVVEAARAAAVDHIVRLSALGAAPGAELALAAEHGRCDELVKQSGIGWTILQPTFFQDNLIGYQVEPIRSQSAFYGASASGETAYVSSADIAAVAATILLDPAPHAGKTYALTGPEALSDFAVAEALSSTLGRKINYVDLSPQQLSAGMRESGTPGWIVDALVGLERVKSLGWASQVSPAVEQITGRPGERLQEFLTRNRERLA